MKQPLWVFGYGSLMWRTGFEPAARVPALLRGVHRSFCVVSHVHRGTPERPGLVAGLDHGGACRGLAFRVAPGEEADVLAYLRAREQPTLVYREVVKPVELMVADGAADGRRRGTETVPALCFVVDRRHRQYAGPLTHEERIELVLTGVGHSGTSIGYLEEMVACLRLNGIRDRGLERLAASVRRHAMGHPTGADPDTAQSSGPAGLELAPSAGGRLVE